MNLVPLFLGALYSALVVVGGIVLWLAIGYVLNGLVNMIVPANEDTFNFIVCIVLWPILVPSKLIGTFVLLPCAIGLVYLVIEIWPAAHRAIAWAKRGFRPLPLPSRFALRDS